MSIFGNIAKCMSGTLVKKQFNLPNFISNNSVNTILGDLDKVVTNKIYGVNIYWSPRGTGKTTNLKHFVTQMNTKENNNVITHYFNAHEENFKDKLDNLYRAKKGNNVIVIDDYDEYHNDSNRNYSRACSLAESSSNEQVNRYIIAVNNPLIADSISKFNGGEKFYTLGSGLKFIGLKTNYMWDDEMMKIYVETKIDILKKNNTFTTNKIKFDDQIKNRLFELAIKSKNPLFVDHIIDTYVHKHEFYCSPDERNDIFKQIYDMFAIMYCDQWTHGISYLNKF
jgi:hypothetical protein